MGMAYNHTDKLQTFLDKHFLSSLCIEEVGN